MADVELSSLGSVIKSAYEGEADTNAFTDAEKVKLAGLDTWPLMEVVASVSGALTIASHHARWLITSGDVTVPHASGSKGFYAKIQAGGGHTVSFNSTTSAAMAAGDVMMVYVTDDADGTPTIKATLTEAANLVSFA